MASSVGGWVAFQAEEVEWGSAACVGAASLGAAGEASYPVLNLKDLVETACPSLVDLQEALGFLRIKLNNKMNSQRYINHKILYLYSLLRKCE